MISTDQPYEQWHFETDDAAVQELLVALLDGCGFEGFEQRTDELLAAAPVDGVSSEARTIATARGVAVRIEVVQPQNWNARWETAYEPVVVPGWCAVRAGFHAPINDVPHEVIITPKMSFGTGHHATTWLMLDAMRDVDFPGKSVLDFGTGTGVLGILAAKLGAARVVGIDNDAWSVENATENAQLNGVEDRVEILAGSLDDISPTSGLFDIILANINRHVLLHYMAAMRSLMTPGGKALISGLLVEDEQIIARCAAAAGFAIHPPRARTGWIMMQLDA